MSLLELEGVSKSYVRGSRERHALRDVSLQLQPGELVGVWGLRHSGRSTLLRIAAGLERPDTGIVRLGGRELDELDDPLAELMGYIQPTTLTKAHSRGEWECVLHALIMPQLARGVQPSLASASAEAALQRTGAHRCAPLSLLELDAAETIRVQLALALTTDPKLLLIDEPTRGVDLLERDDILALLRSLADEGLAILMSLHEGAGFFGVHRALALGGGRLRGHVEPELAQIVRLPRQIGA